MSKKVLFSIHYMLDSILFDIFTAIILNHSAVHTDTKKIIYAIYYPALIIAIMWLIKLVEFVANLDFSDYGNYPLIVTHLYGVLLQPLIHGDFMHLWSNTIPLAFLVWALFYFYGDIALKVFPLSWILTGLITWFIGRPSFHIGASGIVYSVAFFLFFSGLARRMRGLMALSGVVALTYGGFVWNMLPVAEIWRPDLSWEGHLSGAISGTALALWFRNHPPHPEPIDQDSGEESTDDEYWMDQSTTETESSTEINLK